LRSIAGAGLTRFITIPTRGESPSCFHGGGSTFKRKTLKSMIELQACWTDEDLKRFKLIR
jgi:hypothetical protein